MVREVAKELRASLVGGRARAVLLDREASTVLLCLRESTVLFDLHPQAPGVSLAPPQEPPPGARPLPAKVDQVDSIPDERILRIHFRRVRGKSEDPVLIVEFGPRRPNAVIADRSTGRIRSVLSPSTGERPLSSGLLYTLPGGDPRRGADGTMEAETWDRLVDPTQTGGPRRALLAGVAWTSSINAEFLLDSPGGHARWRRLALGTDSAPGWYTGEKGPQAYPVPVGEPDAWHPADSFFGAVAAARAEVEATAAAGVSDPGGEGTAVAPGGTYVPGAAIQALEADLDRAERALARLRGELAGLPAPEELRARADLILARIGEIPRGGSEVVLEGFDGSPVAVSLDPTLDPAANARKLYDRAARAERAGERLPGRIGKAEERLALASRRLEEARSGSLSAERIGALMGPSDGRGSGGGSGPPPSLPYRRFVSSGGLEIRVGRGAKHNDELTFRHSRPMDVWLHARSVGGAHVVLRWDSEDRPPARDLEEAAVLAALHSKARTSGSVPVDWTRRKWVRKPRGAKAGSVTLGRAETVFVEPDPTVMERLDPGD
jgi:predicted ribosome quality control (RQC) complex YloA/Tae2 family protein